VLQELSQVLPSALQHQATIRNREWGGEDRREEIVATAVQEEDTLLTQQLRRQEPVDDESVALMTNISAPNQVKSYSLPL
jgi:hypothetical protein